MPRGFVLNSLYFPQPVRSVPTRHDPGFECRRRQQIFFSVKSPDPFCGSPTLYSTSLGAIFRGFLGPLREADHSTPSTVKVKNEWSYTSTSSICLQGLDTESFNFYREYCKKKNFPGAKCIGRWRSKCWCSCRVPLCGKQTELLLLVRFICRASI